MSELAAVVMGTDQEQRAVLQMQLDATAVSKTVQSFATFPSSLTDPILRRVRDLGVNLVLVDVPRQGPAGALRAIELLRAQNPEVAVFAVGDTSQPQVLIAAM